MGWKASESGSSTTTVHCVPDTGAIGRDDRVASAVLRRRHVRARLLDCRPNGLERPGGRLVGAPQHEADVGMGDEPARAVQHEGVARLPDPDGRDDVPDELQVDLGHHHPDRRTVSGHGDGQVRFGTAVVSDLAEPDAHGPGSDMGRLGGEIEPALVPVQADPGHILALPSRAVDEGQAGDRGDLAEQAQRIDPPPLVGLVGPGELHEPAELAGDGVDEALDPGRRRPRLDAELLAEPGALVAVAEPGLADAADGERNDDRQEQHDEVLLEEAAQ